MMRPGSYRGALGVASEKALALQFLPRELARPADCLSSFSRPLYRRLFIMLPKLHLAKNALALHLLLQRPKRLINIVVTNQYLHLRHHLSKVSIFVGAAYIHRGLSAVHSHRRGIRA